MGDLVKMFRAGRALWAQGQHPAADEKRDEENKTEALKGKGVAQAVKRFAAQKVS
jgi:hypothetical protein